MKVELQLGVGRVIVSLDNFVLIPLCGFEHFLMFSPDFGGLGFWPALSGVSAYRPSLRGVFLLFFFSFLEFWYTPPSP